MTTVMDQARPWLMPSSALAATTHPQLGATPMSSGTGSAAGRTARRVEEGWPEWRLEGKASEQESRVSEEGTSMRATAYGLERVT
jgi:hypothetical protein